MAWRGMGTPAEGARRARMEKSPQWHGGHFENPEPPFGPKASSEGRRQLHNPAPGALSGLSARLSAFIEALFVATAMTNKLDMANEEPDMIKVSVMYPNKPGARFDHTYYRDKHMPLVKARMGESCRFYTVDKGLAGRGPGEPATYIAMCHFYCDSVESFQEGYGPHANEVRADIPNYTDLTPILQFSEVVVGQPQSY